MPNLLRAKEVNDFAELKREGLSIQAISYVTGFDRKTVRKYLLKPEVIPAYRPRPQAATGLWPFLLSWSHRARQNSDRERISRAS